MRLLLLSIFLFSCSLFNHAPQAVSDTATGQQDTLLELPIQTLLANDTDPENQALFLVSFSGVTHGTLTRQEETLIFTPESRFLGDATFSYTISDGTQQSTATVSLTIKPIAPRLRAQDDVLFLDEDEPLLLPDTTLLANDLGSDLTITALDVIQHGTVSRQDQTTFFLPEENFVGVAELRYTLSDGRTTDLASVYVFVEPVNDPPVAFDQTLSFFRETPRDIQLEGSDVDSEGLHFLVLQKPQHGVLVGVTPNISYIPDPGFAGQDSLQFAVSDGLFTSSAAVVTLLAVNSPPTALADTLQGTEDTTLLASAASLLSNDQDLDLDPLVLVSVEDPIGGSVSLQNSQVAFVPEENRNGEASFVYTLSDGQDFASTTVAILLSPVNDAPVAAQDVFLAIEGQPISIGFASLLSNDTDIDSPTLSFVSVVSTKNCSVSLFDGFLTATAVLSADRTASFDYLITDGNLTAIGTALLTVVPAPICGNGVIELSEGCDDGNLLSEDGCSSICKVEGCGDGVLQTGERCDDGNTTPSDGCESDCTLACGAIFPEAERATLDPNSLHCYVGFAEALSWDDAALDCAARGGQLAVVTSAAENQRVRQANLLAEEAWLGANDRSSEGSFAWVSGEAFAFSAFAPGEGNNANDDCLHASASFSLATAETWRDTDCSATKRYICEFTPIVGPLVLNEIDYDQISIDTDEFVEIFNGTGTEIRQEVLANHLVVLVNGNGDFVYQSFSLGDAGEPLRVGQFLVLASSTLPTPSSALRIDLPFETNNIENGAPDAIAIVDLITGRVLDALSYEGSITAANIEGLVGTRSLVEGTPLPVNVADSNDINGALIRSPNGKDTNNAIVDWVFTGTSTPGLVNIP